MKIVCLIGKAYAFKEESLRKMAEEDADFIRKKKAFYERCNEISKIEDLDQRRAAIEKLERRPF
jgi:hypothetical protein